VGVAREGEIGVEAQHRDGQASHRTVVVFLRRRRHLIDPLIPSDATPPVTAATTPGGDLDPVPSRPSVGPGFLTVRHL